MSAKTNSLVKDDTPLEPNPDAMREQLGVLFPETVDQPDGLIELAWTSPKPDAAGRYNLSHARLFRPDQIDELVAMACRLNKREKCNVYIGAGLRKAGTPLRGRTKDENFLSARAVWVDLDDEGSVERADAAWVHCPPSLVVQTGEYPHERCQAWWMLDAWEANAEVLRDVMGGLQGALHSDPSVVQAGRVMRLAGSIAWDIKAGRVPELTAVVSATRVRYRLDDIRGAYPAVPVAQTVRSQPRAAAPVKTGNGSIVVRDVDAYGRKGKVTDGRETHMRDLSYAVLREMIATDGSVPSEQELFDKAWPFYERSTDFTREGRGKDEFLAKCRQTLRRFNRGAIRGMRTIEEAVETYKPKRMAQVGEDFGHLDGKNLRQDRNSIEAHPLLKFTAYDGTLKAPRMIVPGLVEHGTCVIAGQAGIGKTTAIMALACTVAGIHKPGDPLTPKHWRHVVVISEDTSQVQRCLYAIENDLGHQNEIIDRIHVVDAVRMPIAEFVKVGHPYDNMFTRVVEGVKIPPLVICDTKAAIFAAADENDNAETSAMMAGLKQSFSNLPVWVIGHVSKSNMNRTSAKDITLRGASSAEGDANQTMFLVKDEDGRRFLVLGKTRFEPDWRETELRTFISTTIAADEFGDLVPTVLRRVELVPLTDADKVQRLAAAKAEREAAKRRADEERNLAIKAWASDLVKDRRLSNDPLNRTALSAELRTRFGLAKELSFKLIDQWVSKGVLGEVQIPGDLAANNNRRKFLVELTEAEGAEWVRLKALPPEKSTIPDSWRKHR